MIEKLYKLMCDNCRVIYMSDNEDSLDALYSAGWLMDDWGHYCSVECQKEALAKMTTKAKIEMNDIQTTWGKIEEWLKSGTNSVNIECDGGAYWKCELNYWDSKMEHTLMGEGDTIHEAINEVDKQLTRIRGL